VLYERITAHETGLGWKDTPLNRPSDDHSGLPRSHPLAQPSRTWFRESTAPLRFIWEKFVELTEFDAMLSRFSEFDSELHRTQSTGLGWLRHGGSRCTMLNAFASKIPIQKNRDDNPGFCILAAFRPHAECGRF
jgi:hypothetical protein